MLLCWLLGTAPMQLTRRANRFSRPGWWAMYQRWKDARDEANALATASGDERLGDVRIGALDEVRGRLVAGPLSGRIDLTREEAGVMLMIREGSMRLCEWRRGAEFVEVPEVAYRAMAATTEHEATVARITRHDGMGDIVLALNDALEGKSIRDELGITIVEDQRPAPAPRPRPRTLGARRNFGNYDDGTR